MTPAISCGSRSMTLATESSKLKMARRRWEIAHGEHPDIILMDLSLPILDGIAATEKIRAVDGLGGVPRQVP